MSIPDGWGATAGWPPWATTDSEGASEPAAAPGDATLLVAPAATGPAAPTALDRPAAGPWPWPPAVPGEMPPAAAAPPTAAPSVAAVPAGIPLDQGPRAAAPRHERPDAGRPAQHGAAPQLGN